jgi:hypothetical protein
LVLTSPGTTSRLNLEDNFAFAGALNSLNYVASHLPAARGQAAAKKALNVVSGEWVQVELEVKKIGGFFFCDSFTDKSRN